MTIDLSRLPANTNDRYIEFYTDETRYLVLYGSAASGKSYFVAQKIIYRILTQNDHRFLILRKVARTLRHSVFQSIIDMLSYWRILHLFDIVKTDMIITYKPTQSTIIFAGLDDVEKIKSIAGITSIFIEEATEISEGDFTQIDLRLRGEMPNYKQIILCFNPISESNWVKKYWFDEPKNNSKTIKTTYLDNRYIDEEYKRVLHDLQFSNYDLYKVYALGEFGILRGVIYKNITIIDEMPKIKFDHHGIGVDFGFTDPTAAIECGIQGNNLYLNELIHASGLITRDIIKELPIETHIYCDAAEPDRIQEMKREGLWALPGIKDIIAGINRVKSYNIFITRSSTKTLQDFNTYSWKLDKDNKPLDIPAHFNSHSPDAVRYFCHTATQGKAETHSFFLDLL